MSVEFRTESLAVQSFYTEENFPLTRNTLHAVENSRDIMISCSDDTSFCSRIITYVKAFFACIRDLFLACFRWQPHQRNISVMENSLEAETAHRCLEPVGEATLFGRYNQYNAIRRADPNRPVIGSSACPHISAMAAYAYLSDNLHTEEDVDRVVIEGLAKVFQLQDPSQEALQDRITELDRDPDNFDRLLVDILRHRDWMEINHLFRGELEQALDLSEEESILLLQNMNGTVSREGLHNALNAFAATVRPSHKGAALFTAPPNTYGIFLQKNENNELSELAIFEPHGSRCIGNSENGAFFRRWRPADGLDPKQEAVQLLLRLSPPIGGMQNRFSMEPLRIPSVCL
ncbi:MAG: hypothetical protein Tsb0015_04280 [Simkaniaceae bacterium]